MEDMNEMLEQEEMNLDVHKGSVVEGKVVDLTDDKAWISFGYKTEAVLPLHEYSYPEPASLKDVLQRRLASCAGCKQCERRQHDFCFQDQG